MVIIMSNEADYQRKQIMIAASQMILQTTALGIGSIVISEFLADEVAKIIKIDTTKFQVCLLVAFGYSTDNFPKSRFNRPYDEIVELITL